MGKKLQKETTELEQCLETLIRQDRIIRDLKKRIEELELQLEKCHKENSGCVERIADLERKLKFYETASTYPRSEG